jgi:ketosteroid isomerase-like protein
MKRHALVALLCILAFVLAAVPSNAANPSGTPDKVFMQKIWTQWATLNPANVDQYYATGPHTFFDIAPLKYASWEEYKKGVVGVLAGYQSATCTVNDDAQIHNAGKVVWGTATVNYDLVQKSGKHETGAFRWTVVWEKQAGKWVIGRGSASPRK